MNTGFLEFRCGRFLSRRTRWIFWIIFQYSMQNYWFEFWQKKKTGKLNFENETKFLRLVKMCSVNIYFFNPQTSRWVFHWLWIIAFINWRCVLRPRTFCRRSKLGLVVKVLLFTRTSLHLPLNGFTLYYE